MKILANFYSNWRTRQERECARQLLMYIGERNLRDLGFCPERLREGVDAWPWKTTEESDQRESRIANTTNSNWLASAR